MAVTGAIAAVGSALASGISAHQQASAQKKAARAQRRSAEMENARRARRAIAERRMREAELLQAGASEGIRSSSAIQGAVGSLRTQTAANIGHANTQLAGDMIANRALVRGARRAATFDSIASGMNAIGQVGFAFAGRPDPNQTLTKPVPKINPTLTLRP